MKDEKLELKHIAPYLPYGLKFYVFDDPAYLKKYLAQYPNGEWCPQITLENVQEKIFKDGYKPILRRLSDLTKEIEVNREKFVPCINLLKPHINISSSDKLSWLNKMIIWQGQPLLNTENLQLDYAKWQKLFEWHFDVFGLIKKGLAVDINTIKVE